MKSIDLHKFIIVIYVLLLGIFDCYLFGQSCPTLWQNTLTNNLMSYSGAIGKQNLICDQSTSVGSALEFTANYSLSSLTQVSNPIFKITFDGATLFEVKFDNQKITVNRSVQWKECTAWSGGNCSTYTSPIFGTMPFSTWDDQFIVSTTGWISIKLADNGLWIKTSKSASSADGPYKSDFSYGGLHLSGIEAKLNSSATADFTYNLQSSASSGVMLSNITFKAGGLSYIQAVTVASTTESPETNYPPGSLLTAPEQSSMELSAKSASTDLIKMYPNPVEESLTLDMDSSIDDVVEVTLHDITGRKLLSQKHLISQGFNRIQLEQLKSGGLAAGAFIVKVTGRSFSESKMLIMR